MSDCKKIGFGVLGLVTIIAIIVILCYAFGQGKSDNSTNPATKKEKVKSTADNKGDENKDGGQTNNESEEAPDGEDNMDKLKEMNAKLKLNDDGTKNDKKNDKRTDGTKNDKKGENVATNGALQVQDKKTSDANHATVGNNIANKKNFAEGRAVGENVVGTNYANGGATVGAGANLQSTVMVQNQQLGTDSNRSSSAKPGNQNQATSLNAGAGGAGATSTAAAPNKFSASSGASNFNTAVHGIKKLDDEARAPISGAAAGGTSSTKIPGKDQAYLKIK